jgi:uncharacterized protein YciI
MKVGELKKQLEPLDDDLVIIVIGPVLDDDGDESEAWFGLREVASAIDGDTAEDYARFDCVAIEDSDVEG